MAINMHLCFFLFQKLIVVRKIKKLPYSSAGRKKTGIFYKYIRQKVAEIFVQWNNKIRRIGTGDRSK